MGRERPTDPSVWCSGRGVLRGLDSQAMDDTDSWGRLWKMTASLPKRPEFVGIPQDEAENIARTQHLRPRAFGPPIDPPVAFTTERDPNRLNLLIRDGVVADAAIG